MKNHIECVPNFCEGQSLKTIDAIGNAICSVSGVELKCIDSGYYANRTVYTFLGNQESIMDAAYRSIKEAIERIDMRKHQGTHPRFGAVDVFPFVSLSKEVNENELIYWVDEFAQKISMDFQLPIYLYEKSAKSELRRDLSKIRQGEYEGLEQKMMNSFWQPDYCTNFNSCSGATALGVRNLLVAFNVNLETKNVEIAKRIAEEVRASGKIAKDSSGNRYRVYGRCRGVKAIGWYIKDFDKVQVSMNIVDANESPVHKVFEICCQIAESYNTRVTGSELIGCIPKKYLVDAGRYFSKNKLTEEADLIQAALSGMNLTEVKPFSLDKNTIDIDI